MQCRVVAHKIHLLRWFRRLRRISTALELKRRSSVRQDRAQGQAQNRAATVFKHKCVLHLLFSTCLWNDWSCCRGLLESLTTVAGHAVDVFLRVCSVHSNKPTSLTPWFVMFLVCIQTLTYLTPWSIALLSGCHCQPIHT